MKIKLISSIKTSVVGLQSFLERMIQKYPEIENFKEELVEFVEQSGCKKIEFAGFEGGNFPIKGLSLGNGTFMMAEILSYSKEHLMFIFFHEIAHQYQYKLYGKNKMYDAYLGRIPIDEAVQTVKRLEIEADDFAQQKCFEYAKKGLLDGTKTDHRVYHKHSDFVFKSQIENMQKLIETLKTKNEAVLEIMIYNILKSGLSISSAFDKVKNILK